MLKRILYISIVLVFTYTSMALAGEYPRSEYLVNTQWLEKHLKDPDIRIVDMSFDRSKYLAGHIPGAVYVNVNDIREPVPEGGFRIMNKDDLEKFLGSVGISHNTMVVIYDDAGGLHASRLFFTLDFLGHKRMALLNGGIFAWRRKGLPLEKGFVSTKPSVYNGTPRPDRVATAEWILKHLKDPSVVIVDSRSRAEYTGKRRMAKHGGHIPGAINIEWKMALNRDLTFKSPEELLSMYEKAGVTRDKIVVTYCQTHHRAAHTYFVLRLLGYEKVRGYDRSWAEWGNRDDLPYEVP